MQGDVEYSTPMPADEGIWQSTNGGISWTQIPDNGITHCGDDAFGPNSGCGVEPVSVPSPATTIVTATSTLATSPGSAFVTVAPPTLVGVSLVSVTAAAANGATNSNIVTLIVQ